MINLGRLVIDPETGFKGKVTARTKYLYGEPRVMVESVDSTGRPIEWWFEESRVNVLSMTDEEKVHECFKNIHASLKNNLEEIEELDNKISTLK